jgi:DNA modification methylase
VSRLLVRADVMPREWGELRGGRPGGFTGIPLRDKSIHCCICSPPYFHLRDYGVDGQIGLESTVHEYVDSLVHVFAEVWRVMRDDSTLWVNLGDSYSSGGRKGHGTRIGYKQGTNRASANGHDHVRPSDGSIRPKNLCGVPWRVAFALQDWGWNLRSEIIWHRPNPMTESVKDRPSRAHEQVFLFTKRDRYFYDREAVREPLAATSIDRDLSSYKMAYASQFRGSPTDHRHLNGKQLDGTCDMAGRNLRTVWKIPVASTREKHYASYPERLVTPCIKAGTSEKGVCPACGAPWRRVVEKKRIPTRPGNNSKIYIDPEGSPYEQHSGTVVGNRDPKRHVTMTVTLGWEPTCSCNAGDPIPAVVLDPFTGTSTTGKVARDLGRRFVGLDLKGEYLEISRRRLDEPLRPPGTKKPRRVSIPSQGSLFDPTE